MSNRLYMPKLAQITDESNGATDSYSPLSLKLDSFPLDISLPKLSRARGVYLSGPIQSSVPHYVAIHCANRANHS